MEGKFKKRFKRVTLVLILVFIVMLVFRIIAGEGSSRDYSFNRSVFSSLKKEFAFSNYASQKYESKSQSSLKSQVDQKYEKVADIRSTSDDFQKEESEARNKIEKYKGLIQYETKSGNNGSRKLDLVVGVPPEDFDNLYNDLISIGNVVSKEIVKKDKTNEYKELNAKKASLEKIRASLIKLKSNGGKIEEFMQLENRILEIEEELQGLGVSLGHFDDENEFCTVSFSLVEYKVVAKSFSERVINALEWTIKYYLGIIAILFFIMLAVYILLVIIEKLKIIEKIINRK